MIYATTRSLAVLAALAALPAAAQTAAAKPTPAPVSEGNVMQLSGTIEAINATTREVTVKFGDVVHTFAAKPDVKRFAELKVGDKLTADYNEAVLMEVRKPGAAAPKPAAGGDVMRVPGQAVRPSGTLVQQQVATVVVKAIDAKTPAVTLQKSDGSLVTVKVAHPERIKDLQVGHTIDVTYTEAFTVRLE
jgi:Cu/Ag efflux protein CusF